MSEVAGAWEAETIRALRLRLGESQQAFADRLGTRQQTVSEWERGLSHPRRMAQRLLGLVAESAAPYEVNAPEATSTLTERGQRVPS
ncbi:MAG: helix-turn-helix domain-containing protein [Chloroflexi bacterium]|nr:MAG: helix-turn-helix domain-containing protein [Chloroflexota bacterium]